MIYTRMEHLLYRIYPRLLGGLIMNRTEFILFLAAITVWMYNLFTIIFTII